MEVFTPFLEKIDDPEHRARIEEVLDWTGKYFPQLGTRIAWNKPIFTDHGTFIIGFSVSKKHMAVAPEEAGILRFTDEIAKAGYGHTKGIIRIPWENPVNYDVLKQLIEYNIEDKADCTTFWRK
ncbi:iron chaperone [Oceanobacillus jeddahense]|uniref:Iron chaperone n=1 Tax=Oceanobacillus jeddahense TaxID=1462527 RepID=A0ABY5JYQ9_9BACI|nr:iron chaperone [Oceanobacillus jeddahense]UUI03654.1 iron chaperone [Oceanobacillus jeddahense]